MDKLRSQREKLKPNKKRIIRRRKGEKKQGYIFRKGEEKDILENLFSEVSKRATTS